MPRIYHRLRYWLLVVSERLRATVRVALGSTFPRLYLPEHRRATIRVATALISYAGAALAFVTLPRPLNIALAVALLLLERVLSAVVYRLQTLFVPRPIEQELHDVGFDHLVVADVHAPPEHPPALFLGFSSCEKAINLFEVLAEWCGHPAEGTIDDREHGRIGISVVFEGTETYRVFLYRTLTPPAGRHASAELGSRDLVDELVQVSVVRTRHFPVVGQWPAIYEAQRLLGDGREYILAAACVINGAVTPCTNIPRFLKNRFKVRARYQLRRRTEPMEYLFYLIRDSRP